MTPQRRRAAARVWRPALLAALLAGCAAGKADVTGKVTYQSKALTFGTVVVRGPDGLDIPGTINPDGSYRVTGAAAGKALVGVVSRDPGPTLAKGRATAKFSRDADEGPAAAGRSK